MREYEEAVEDRRTLVQRVGELEEMVKLLQQGHEKSGDGMDSHDIRIGRVEKEIGLAK